MKNENRIKSVSYAKWGYIFILPFFLSYAIFSLIPLADTIRNSFYEYYAFGLEHLCHVDSGLCAPDYRGAGAGLLVY